MAIVNYQNWSTINLNALAIASQNPFDQYEQMINSIDTDVADVFPNGNSTAFTGYLGDGFFRYNLNMTGRMNSNASAFTIDQFDLFNDRESSTYQGTLTLNLNSGALSGFYNKLGYRSNITGDAFELIGRLTTNSYTGDPSGGTVNQIRILSGGHEISLRGNLTVNSNLDITGGTITDLILTDNQGHSLNATGLAMNARSFDQIMSANTPDLNALSTLITASLADNSIITGSGIDEILAGGARNDTLFGLGGNDTLNGNAGADSMEGGDGNDTYIVDNVADKVTELENEGVDEVKTGVNFVLGANIERLTLLGVAGINATGNAHANLITGNSANNTLDGKAGADTLLGGKGNDVYIVDDLNDVVTELANEGIDLVRASVSYRLSEHIEQLTLTDGTVSGGTTAINGSGNSLNNIITGNAGNNVLDGAAGVDTLIGGLGDDTYVVDLAKTGTLPANFKVALQDTITENAITGSGIDTITLRLMNGVNYADMALASTLTLAANLEQLDASATANTKLNLTGNAQANTLIGNDADNILDGVGGVDTLIGGAGNDTYLIDIKTSGTGTNARLASFDDTILEASAITGGLDTIKLRGTATLPINHTLDLNTDFVGIENMDASATGLSKLNLSGNDEDNWLIGNAAANILIGGTGNDTLDGGAGIDIMMGGRGDDIYVVDHLADTVTENLDEGVDLVKASVTYVLTNVSLEHLALTGVASINGTGNAGNNTLTGNAGNNILNGLGGTDRLLGGKGNDTYIVDDVNDVISELVNEGTDLANASVSFSLFNADHVENLTLTNGTPNGGIANIDGTGNRLKNILTGNAGDNQLDGGDDVDSLVGGLGNDTYVVDLVKTGTLPANFKLALQDTISETAVAGAGVDTVKLRLLSSTNYADINTASTLTLGANLEHLDASTTGTTKLNLTGNALANTLTGNDADNILDGAAGLDTLIGGSGNDRYLLDLKLQGTGTLATITFDDSIVELNGLSEGIDTIFLRGSANLSTASTLSLTGNWVNLEGLDISATGNTRLNLTGNNLGNTLIGNAAVNSLTGGISDDLLNGGTGADDMQGFDGNDIYIVDNLNDKVTEQVNAGMDEIKASISFTLSANLEHLTLTGTAAINGTGNADANILTGNTANNILDGKAGTDTMLGGKGNDTYIVDDINDQIFEISNEGTDIARASVDYTLSAEVEQLILTDGAINGGTQALNGTGNHLKNTITGNAGNNVLNGLGGTDTLMGGLGNDTYQVTLIQTGTSSANFRVALEDTITEAANAGLDTVQLSGEFIHLNATTLALANHLERLDASLTGNTKLHLTGNAADNTLTGNNADNSISGGTGNDVLIGGAGADTLTGGGGADTFLFRATQDTNGNNVDTITDFEASVDKIDLSLINPASTSLTFSNTSANANAVWYGQAQGNTIVYVDTTGDAAADMQIKLNGLFNLRSGNFNLASSAADATSPLPDLFSMNDDSVNFNVIGALAGYNSANLYDTLAGNDTITLPENTIDAKLIGFDATKTFHGGAGNDVIIGGSMNDIIAGDAGNDTLIGNHGDDTYMITDEDDEVIENVNEGTDLVKASVHYILSNNVENLTLTDGESNGGSTALNGTGNALANTITGNAGNNIIDGGDSADKLIGGLGDDTYIVDLQIKDRYSGNIFMGSYLALEDTVVEAKNAGNDTFVLRGNAPGGYAFTLVDNIENLDAQSVIRVDGPSSAGITIYGNSLDNRIWGNNAGNIISGGAGNDMLFGGDGEDTLDGGEGVNTMAGGKGSDTYIIRNPSDVIFELPSDNGLDRIFTFVSINLDLFPGIETAEVYYGAQNVVISRSTGNTYSGSDGNDSLIGSNDKDTFLSSSGNDVMTGGLGADTFVWSLLDKSVLGKPAIDTITDFNLAEDKLDLDALLVGETSENIQNYLDITTSMTAGVINTEIRISNTGGFTGGNYLSSAENHHITLIGANLLSGTSEAVLLQNLFN